MISRADRSPLGNWWWTVDKPMLFGLIALLFVGLILSFAASPSIAEQLKLESFFFVKRHAVFVVPALLLLIGVSLLSPKMIRRLCLLVFIIGIGLLVYTLIAGAEIKGSRRWISIMGFSLQPSEIVKPAFIVLCAWFFSESARRPELPGNLFAILLLGVFCALLVAQPDIGQTALVVMTWCAMFFMAGLSWIWIAILWLLGLGGLFAAYLFVPHVTGRIDRFLDPASGDTYQVDQALSAFLSGGWFGRGPGEGIVKRQVPDAHTDFIFA
ncbi:MAG: FtsW/RodA/SpoVE family cell cycle protein, partial [Pseudomonadota bacterium]